MHGLNYSDIVAAAMGESVSKLFCCNLGTKEIRILMLGLDNAGKTSKKLEIFYKLLFIFKLHCIN